VPDHISSLTGQSKSLRCRLGHDRPRLRIRSKGLLQAAQIHWEVITVGPTSPTRSTSS